ncbi:sodium-independent sulfate anion transporter-like [Watersipora subatra]|uniref:sodium-independent sulfate anion transporter-like n=1 Tax=Watersipora subatra TaxID=2589382 RepID=UPI00355C12C5
MAAGLELAVDAVQPDVPLCINEERETSESDSDTPARCSCNTCTHCPDSVMECLSEFPVVLSNIQKSPIARYGREFCTAKNARRKLPIVNWLPKYRLKHFVGDLVAGLTVGLTVIPQGLAYAVVAELPPQYGLYSAFMGVFIYTFLGTSKDITLGPTAIMSLLVAEFGAEKSPVHGDPTYAIVLTLITGLLQLVMGLLNMGFIVQFISFPVISGFTSSAAILIAFGQVRKLLGLKDVPRAFKPQVRATFEKLGETNLYDMAMGISCLVALIALKKVKELADARMKKATGARKAGLKLLWLICTARNAVIVVITAGIAGVLQQYQLYGLTLTKPVEAGLPAPSLPKFTLNHFDEHTNTTITRTTAEIFSDISEGFVVVTLIGMLESIAIAKAFARRNEYKIDPSQELIAIGVANSISSFFHSYPVTGSFSRTAINSQSGVRTPVGGVWTGALVILSIIVLTPYFAFIPESALAAVIIAAVIQMVEYEAVISLWKVKKMDLIPLLITFFVSLLESLEIGIVAGIGFSLVMVLFPMARPGLKVEYVSASTHLGSSVIEGREDAQAVILELAQGLTFPGVEYMKDKIMKHGVYESPPNAIILDASHFSNCDYTMVLGVTQIADYFNKHDLTFVIANCSEDIKGVLSAARIKHLRYSDSVQAALDLVFGQYLTLSHLHNMSNGNHKLTDSLQSNGSIQPTDLSQA